MIVDRIFKTVLAYIAIYLMFDILLYIVDKGWQLTALAIVAALAIFGVFLWGTSQRVDGPNYPSTVRARLQQGFRNGAKKG
jgi:hypothetical protein